MNPRTTGILFLAAAALAAFVWLYEIEGEADRAEAEEATKRIFAGLAAEDVSEIALATSDGVSARVRRVDAGWELVEPLSFPGDPFALDGMASGLAELTRESVFEDPQPLSVYGLEDDDAVLRFVAAGETRELRLGKEAPMGGNSYASVGGDAAVYTVSTFALNALRKSLDDLREKRIARFDRAAVTRIRASWPDGRVELEKGEGGWRITAPIDDEADRQAVDSLLSDLSFLRAEGFVDAPPADEEAGLSPPDLVVELEGAPPEEGGEALAVSIEVGREVEEGSRLVRSGQPSLFRITAEWLADVPRDLVAYRDRELSSFAATDAQRVEVAFQPRVSTAAGDAPLVIIATRGEAGWTSEPGRFAPGKVAGLVNELSSLSAADILADAMGPAELDGLGLEPPIARIAVRAEEGGEPLAAIRLGVVRAGEGIAAQREGDPTVFQLDVAVAERLPVSLEAFRNHFAAVEEVEVDPEPPSEAAEPAIPQAGVDSP